MKQSLLLTILLFSSITFAADTILVEAENFDDIGKWVIDQQFMDEMGSPFLLAHGLGIPVEDATTKVKFADSGKYQVWVRTRDWVAPWKTPDTPPAKKAKGTPGKFQVIIARFILAIISNINPVEQNPITVSIGSQSR